MDGAGLPCCGFGDEPVEECAGGGADVVAALGVPLDAENKMRVWMVRVLATFDGLDDGVLRAAGRDAETVAGNADGLMVTGVNRKAEEVLLFRGFFRCEQSAEKRLGSDRGSVGDGDFAAGGVIDGERSEILHEGAAAPGVEDLNAKADGEERLVEIVRVLEEELVDVFAGGVGGGALGDGIVAVLVGVHVGRTAGEKNSLTGIDEVNGLDRGGVERDCDGLAAAALDTGGVLGPGALVVLGVGAGGLGDRDARLHSYPK